MGYISEDYCSEELSGMLMEKGYIGTTNTYLSKDGLKVEQITLQSAMKWLRNKYDIVCSVGLFTDFPGTPPYWSFNILSQPTANVMYEAFDIKCKTYEEACEEAIKYCLEKLI